MYGYKAALLVFESYLIRSGVLAVRQLQSRKSPYSHTLVRYRQV